MLEILTSPQDAEKNEKRTASLVAKKLDCLQNFDMMSECLRRQFERDLKKETESRKEYAHLSLHNKQLGQLFNVMRGIKTPKIAKELLKVGSYCSGGF
jgi:hypothetical protein